MASIKLGMVITDIAGSVGGSTFRRTPRGVILYNKQGTQIKSAFSPASQKNQLGNIFSTWQNLSNDEKTYWAEQALLYPQKDKFGRVVYLSGRQFFTKLSAQMLPSQQAIVTHPLDDRLCPAILTEVIASKNDEKMNFVFNVPIENFFIFISIYQLRKGSGVKPHAHFRRTVANVVMGSSVIEIYNSFKNQYPLASSGDKFGANIQFCSNSGFLTSVQAVEFIWE